MNILVIGEGGREHAIIKTIKKSKKCEKLFALPGNAGISSDAECVNINTNDFEKILEFVKNNNINLVVVGPEVPLANGITDYLNNHNVRVFGPVQKAAEIEASKVFAKNLMKKYNIPTATFEVFENYDEAINYIKNNNKYPVVIKADGLAAGKGVLIPKNYDEAESALKEIMLDKTFGDAGNRVVIEKFLKGIEMSILAFTDGKTVVPMVSAKDYKKVGEGDTGLNTGGMGAISPNPIYTDEVADYCYKNIFLPTIEALTKENRKFKGVLYFGMIKTDDGIYVIEYNCRFGDPETQVILPRLKTDIVDIFEAVIDERLNEIKIEWLDDVAMTIVLASGGYPKEYKKGYEIKNLDKIEKDIIVFHAGTKIKDGKIVTNGGRVLNVTYLGKSFDEVKGKILKACQVIDFENKYFRKDIGI
ncbi:MAG TPA: phosphoribosylamine--glycine ligase [Ignavibacteriales bacterium]|nr:phosphoribosylamine--glycine ligase [Ignavibacteriales bacterium]HOL82029.1 phosphoribosylamine--glycine ligase [Ignavibacteriales bacterium]HOM66091.1 phosphoribosylamine--glycine ligase [Ignavibacteriales bacterium]HPD67691.1 phosphoribosylamine--glycine ligase [Ignavibacteriales bacterium]HPP34164.1 phosphoribosylamine--glycine ligase [Ignavibacteriales bacterium]